MKAFLNFRAVLPILLSFTINLERPVGISKERDKLNDILLLDYQHLSDFSEQMKAYGISEVSFKNLFWKGALKSFHFYQSPNLMEQYDINNVLKKNLVYQYHLKHQLKVPSMNTSTSDKSSEVLHTFSGEWFGKWQSMDVEHLWLPIRSCNVKIGLGYKVIGFQSCFTGDGFGWNYLIQNGEEITILGHVYHFNKNGALDYENPHYAFLNDQSQLTWVSDNHVYYEFVCEDKKCAFGKHYVITAMPYSNNDTLKFGTPVQAIYTSRNNANKLGNEN